MSRVVRLSELKKKRWQSQVCFSRQELNKLLSVYSRRVIRGEWKDYAISLGNGSAAFSVFNGSGGAPVFTVVKLASAKGTGDYVVYDGNRRMKRGASIDEALRLLERQIQLVTPQTG